MLWLAFAVLLPLSAQTNSTNFTDAIQDLAVSIACKGTYSGAEADLGYDPADYYTPQMMAQRFALESGNKTMTTTFYGICFNYAQFAWSDITRYKSWYNQQGMYEGQFWLAGVKENSNQIELMSIGTKNDYSRLQNGEYIKTYSSSLRNVKTHRLNNQGERATNHAWLWIQRADGVWFWIDPTWTDNCGYVVYGYVSKSDEEIQCRPNKELCINYPSYLDNLPSPPAMGKRKAPSKTADSTNREETITTAYAQNSYSKNDAFFSVGLVGIFDSGSYDYSTDKGGIELGIETTAGRGDIFAILAVDVLWDDTEEDKTHEYLAGIELGYGLLSFFQPYAGALIGLQTEDSSAKGFAWKANIGSRIPLGDAFCIRADVSYGSLFGTGLTLAGGIGF